MRLDAYVFQKKLSRSRTDAKNLILQGDIIVDGETISKPSYEIDENSIVTLREIGTRYVSRGALKLEGAFLNFNLNAKGTLALDVGASSGGFTDFLLKNGAEHVIAVDSGSGQLAECLRSDPRVTVFENFNARYMKAEDFSYSPSLVVMDVSFISATCIIPAIYNVSDVFCDFVCLIKPQFEVGRSGIGKGGIVRDEKLRKQALDKVVDFAVSVGFEFKGYIVSPIKGGDGNIEYLAHFVKNKLKSNS